MRWLIIFGVLAFHQNPEERRLQAEYKWRNERCEQMEYSRKNTVTIYVAGNEQLDSARIEGSSNYRLTIKYKKHETSWSYSAK